MDELNEIIEHLVSLGEDRDELEFWRTVAPSFPPDKQRELINNLTEELQSLQKSSES
ncbi:MAG: hypothetical protein ACOY3M_06865 [Patescibacteria group bacterium]